MGAENAAHLLRGEDSESFKWTWDRLPQGLQPSDVGVQTRGHMLELTVHGKSVKQWELPADADLDTRPVSAQLHAAPPAASEEGSEHSKLVLNFGKKEHDGSPEALQKLRMEAMASNRMRVIPVTPAEGQ